MMRMNLLTAAVICAYVGHVYGQIEVNTNAGLFRGSTDNSDGIVHKFIGIPYAKPPIQNLRFAKPVKPEKLEYPFVANLYKPYCPQILPSNNVWSNMPLTITRSDEDCLYLNIYVPDERDNIPVVVFLNGEDFLTGRSDVYDAHKLAAKGGVIVVTLNYRLGILGFLYTGESDAPGNLGLWDQHMALEWVRDNIAPFGGNPEEVTLMGWSAGATSAALHALSEKSKGLFSRVILQSGGASGATVVNTRQEALNFSKALGLQTECLKKDNSASLFVMIDCLKSSQHYATVLLIRGLGISRTNPVRHILNSVWAPVIDGDFIPDDPTKLLTDHSYLTSVGFYDLDIMTGVTRDDGTHLLDLLRNAVSPSRYSALVTTAGLSSMFMANEVIPALVQGRLGHENFNSNQYVKETYPSGDDWMSQAVAFSLYGDAYFVAPVVQFARAHSHQNSRKGKTFLYLFDYSAAIGPGSTSHGTELPYVFGLSPLVSQANVMPPSLDAGEIVYSDQVVSYWSNFMKTGDPNSDDVNLPVTWPRFKVGSEQILVFSQGMFKDKSVGENLFEDKVSFWTECLLKISQGAGDLPQTCPVPQFLTSAQQNSPSSTSLKPVPVTQATTTTTTTTVAKSTTPMTTKTITTRTSKSTTDRTTPLAAKTTTDNEDSVTETFPPTDFTSGPQTLAPISNPQASTENPDLSTLPCNSTQPTRFLDRLGMDADTAETTIIALAAATGAFGLIALIVSCMLCAKKRKRTDYY